VTTVGPVLRVPHRVLSPVLVGSSVFSDFPRFASLFLFFKCVSHLIVGQARGWEKSFALLPRPRPRPRSRPRPRPRPSCPAASVINSVRLSAVHLSLAFIRREFVRVRVCVCVKIFVRTSTARFGVCPSPDILVCPFSVRRACASSDVACCARTSSPQLQR
jgi:hypothetical protein